MKVHSDPCFPTAESPVLENFLDFVVEVPTPPKMEIAERNHDWFRRTPIKRDYLEREARNRSLGLAGELLVMEYEARRLQEIGAKKYVDRID